MSQQASPKSNLIWVAIFAPVLFFTVRAVQFALIGSYAPAWLAALSAVLVMTSLTSAPTMSRWALKLFGILLVTFGIIRVLFGILLKFAPIDSAHAIDATSVIYFIISALLLCGGVYLFKNSAALKS